MRFPRDREKAEDKTVHDAVGWPGPPSFEGRSCCCSARPAVGVLSPPTPARPHAIRSQMKSIYRKLDATNRHQAVTRARELDLLER